MISTVTVAARLGVQRQRASDAERLVVGMGDDAQDALAQRVVAGCRGRGSTQLRRRPGLLDQHRHAVAAEGVGERVGREPAPGPGGRSRAAGRLQSISPSAGVRLRV